MITSFSLGHKITFKSGSWLYKDGRLINDTPKMCVRCNKYPTNEGYDDCLSKFAGMAKINSACCGHGIEKGYIILNKNHA